MSQCRDKRRRRQKVSRSRSSSNNSEIQRKKVFGFQIFVAQEVVDSFESYTFQRIRRDTGVQSICFNPELSVPDLKGKIVQIYDKDMYKKYLSAKHLFGIIKDIQCKVLHDNDIFTMIIFVPQGMVSLLIGSRGHQINKIMKDSNTQVIVNQPISKMTYRTVKISGPQNDVAKACRIIYEILQEKSSIAHNIQKQPSPLDLAKVKVKAKLILSTSMARLFSAPRGLFSKLQDLLVSSIRQKQKSKLIRRDQQIVTVIGRLQDVQATMVVLVSHLHKKQKRQGDDKQIKMLIPANYVSKLIGQRGYMIQNIKQKSGGAQIKIKSDKTQRESSQCPISISGTRQQKIDAVCLILEQIQCFKNGGPILQSGKNINENFMQQFKSALPIRNHSSQEDRQIGQLSISQSRSSKRGRRFRSRSRSRSRQLTVSSYSKSRSKSRVERRKSYSPSHSQDKVQIKMLLPRSLANDYYQLKYMRKLSKAQLTITDQVQSQSATRRINCLCAERRGARERVIIRPTAKTSAESVQPASIIMMNGSVHDNNIQHNIKSGMLNDLICQHFRPPIFFTYISEWDLQPLCQLCLQNRVAQKHNLNNIIDLKSFDNLIQAKKNEMVKAAKRAESELQIHQIKLLKTQKQVQQQIQKWRKTILNQVDTFFNRLKDQLYQGVRSTCLQIVKQQVKDLLKSTQWIDLKSLGRLLFRVSPQQFTSSIGKLSMLENPKINLEEVYQQVKIAIAKYHNPIFTKNIIQQVHDFKEKNKLQRKCGICRGKLKYLTDFKKSFICQNCGKKQANYSRVSK